MSPTQSCPSMPFETPRKCSRSNSIDTFRVLLVIDRANCYSSRMAGVLSAAPFMASSYSLFMPYLTDSNTLSTVTLGL